jgi:hypothetical protein
VLGRELAPRLYKEVVQVCVTVFINERVDALNYNVFSWYKRRRNKVESAFARLWLMFEPELAIAHYQVVACGSAHRLTELTKTIDMD